MNCNNCGNVIPEGNAFCEVCGAPVAQEAPVMETPVAEAPVYAAPVNQEKKGLSIASLVLGIISVITWLIPLFGFPTALTGLILGCIGVRKGGKGMGIAGIVLCSIFLLLTIANGVLGCILAVEMMESGLYY